MENLRTYAKTAQNVIDRILDEEGDHIETAASEIATRIAEGRLLYVFGPGGHSSMAGEEVFYRAGGLCPVSPILDAGVSLSTGAWKTTFVERVEGYSPGILEYYGLTAGDIIIINNAAGINSMTIDAAQECRSRGVYVVGMCAREFASHVPDGHPARHSSNRNLYDIADVCIDLKVPLGDAVIEVEGVDQKIGPVSTIAISFALHSVVIRTIEKLVAHGVSPEVWRSANIPGGDEANRKNLEKYRGVIRHL